MVLERLVDQDLSATIFDPEAGSRPVPKRARTVIIGGGIIGASTAYHLAAAGDTDVLLLERNVLGSGTTWHAAGLCSSIRSSAALTDLARYGIQEYRRLEAASGMDVSFNQCGSLLLARTDSRLEELRYTAAIARQKGIDARMLTPEEIVELWPLASADYLVGGFYQPEDGHVNPGHVVLAYAKLAHELGAVVREHIEVVDLLQEDGKVTGVRTAEGDIACERVVLAAGLWSRDLAERAGVNLPLYAAEHVHVRTDAVDGAEPSLPVLRDMDGYLYVRHENGQLLVGAFEPNGIPRRVDEISADGFAEFPADWNHFEPIRANAEQRVPALLEATFERFLNAPESFTPDSNFCLGETVEVEQLFVAAGFNSQGIIFGPGVGRALAVWMDQGVPDFDAASVDVQRFARQQSNRTYLHERTKEGLGNLYAQHWPMKQPVTARNVRRSPLHERTKAANACFGETAGWERPNWYAPVGAQPEYVYSFGRQNWLDYTGEEHRAVRDAVGLFDLSSFAKFEVAGPDAVEVMQRFCTANVDMPVGKLRYTLMLNQQGRIELDGTAVRLGEQRFWVITPAFSQHKTLGMLKRIARGTATAVFDATSGYATIAVMGPKSRELLTRISPDDFSDDAQPFGTARTVEVGNGHALALRVSFVGELGYELYPTADEAVNLYDAIVAAGEDLGLKHAGFHALDSLRSEKGYRHLGHDIGPLDDPFDVGLGFTLSWKKEIPFVGREALEGKRGQPPARRAVYFALKDPAVVLMHDETILVGGKPVGRMTSGSYGYTLGRACGIATISADIPMDADFSIDCAGRVYEIEVSETPFYDPGNSRMKGA